MEKYIMYGDSISQILQTDLFPCFYLFFFFHPLGSDGNYRHNCYDFGSSIRKFPLHCKYYEINVKKLTA